LAWAGVGAAVLLPASTAWADVAGNHVRDVRVKVDGAVAGATRIEIVGTAAPMYTVRAAEGGRRLFVDISDADVAGAPPAITEAVGVVGGILTQAYPTASGSMTRLTVNLERDASYRVVPDGTSREAAEQLGRELAAFPQATLRADRLSVYDGSLEAEFARGSTLLDEARTGAARFVRKDF